MRHLVSKGLFTEPAPGRFALNDLARGLLGESGRVGFDLDAIGGRMAYAWGTLLSAVRTGKPAYHEVFGRGFWEDLDAHPAVAASFDALMGVGRTRRTGLAGTGGSRGLGIGSNRGGRRRRYGIAARRDPARAA